MSDEDDDHSCEEIKNLLSKIKEDKERYVELQPEPEPICINPSICRRGENVDPMWYNKYNRPTLLFVV